MCCGGWGFVQLYCMMAVLLPSSVGAARHSHEAVKYATNPRVDGWLQGFGWVWFNSWKVDKNKFKLICWVRKLPRQPKNLLYYNYGWIQVILKFTLKRASWERLFCCKLWQWHLVHGVFRTTVMLDCRCPFGQHTHLLHPQHCMRTHTLLFHTYKQDFKWRYLLCQLLWPQN